MRHLNAGRAGQTKELPESELRVEGPPAVMGGCQAGAARLHLLPPSRSWRFNVAGAPLRRCEIPRLDSFKTPSGSQQRFSGCPPGTPGLWTTLSSGFSPQPRSATPVVQVVPQTKFLF